MMITQVLVKGFILLPLQSPSCLWKISLESTRSPFAMHRRGIVLSISIMYGVLLNSAATRNTSMQVAGHESSQVAWHITISSGVPHYLVPSVCRVKLENWECLVCPIVSLNTALPGRVTLTKKCLGIAWGWAHMEPFSAFIGTRLIRGTHQ